MVLKEGKGEGKIVFIVGSLESGGIERLVTEWSLYLKNHTSWQPSVICILKKSGQFLDLLTSHGIPVYYCKLSNKGQGLAPFVYRISRLIKSLNPQVVHSQVSFSLLWQTMGYVLGGVKKIILTQHNEYQNWNKPLAKMRLRLYYSLSRPFISQYTCVSTPVQKSLSALLNVPSEKFKVIHNGVNTASFYTSHQKRDVAREKLNVQKEDFVIGMVASFSEQKGHRYMLEACSLLKEEHRNFKVILIGSGSYDHLVKMSETLGLTKHIFFLGNRNDVPSLLPGFDCFALSSLWEGMPVALLEAMSCQLPAVATRTSGITEVIEHEKSGLLVKPADPVSLKDALLRIIAEPGLAGKLGANGRQVVEEKFSLSNIVKVYIKLYQS